MPDQDLYERIQNLLLEQIKLDIVPESIIRMHEFRSFRKIAQIRPYGCIYLTAIARLMYKKNTNIIHILEENHRE